MRFFSSNSKGTAFALFLCGVTLSLVKESTARAATDNFNSLMASSMSRMDRNMMVASSGDPDRDFATMMIPHHQGAVDMAKVELRYGHDKVLRRLAEGIIVEQQQEIMVMHQAIAALPAAATSSTGKPPVMMAMPGMQHPSKKDQ